jgi:hypothetical protein
MGYKDCQNFDKCFEVKCGLCFARALYSKLSSWDKVKNPNFLTYYKKLIKLWERDSVEEFYEL